VTVLKVREFASQSMTRVVSFVEGARVERIRVGADRVTYIEPLHDGALVEIIEARRTKLGFERRVTRYVYARGRWISLDDLVSAKRVPAPV